MKHLPFILILILFIAGCDTVDEVAPIDTFKLEEHAITGKFISQVGGSYVILFGSNNLAKIYTVLGLEREIPYEVKEDTLFITDTKGQIYKYTGYFVLKDGVLEEGLSDYPLIQSSTLLKIPEMNMLAGKTFTGQYLRQNNTILHNNFFYTFRSDKLEHDAGFQVGTVVRTESYELIGNIAAFSYLKNEGDQEFMIYSGGKLEINYLTSKLEQFHGTLIQLP